MKRWVRGFYKVVLSEEHLCSYQAFLPVVRPWSSLFRGARSRHPSPPQMEKDEGEESLRWNSPPQAGGVWRSHSRTATGAECSTWNIKYQSYDISFCWSLQVHLILVQYWTMSKWLCGVRGLFKVIYERVGNGRGQGLSNRMNGVAMRQESR